ncbi:transposase [Neolewinella agarilytica]|nr:transposase [Neolewinella agarilytica]
MLKSKTYHSFIHMYTLNRQMKHRPIGHVPVHIVYRLAGSLPVSVIQELKRGREALFLQAEAKINALPDQVYKHFADQCLEEIGEGIENLLEKALHEKSNGPYHLKEEKLAKIVIDSWHWLVKEYGLYVYAICVMSNHVHVLLRGPEGESALDPALIMKTHKSFTANQCNKLLGTSGSSFWAPNYFDRDVREGTFTRVVWYILNNPFQAGLVQSWKDWPGTWLHPDFHDLFGG